MNVTIILKGHLMWYTEYKKKIHNIKIERNLKIVDVVKLLKVPMNQVGIVLKNGEKVSVYTSINEGEEIEIVPVIAGG